MTLLLLLKGQGLREDLLRQSDRVLWSCCVFPRALEHEQQLWKQEQKQKQRKEQQQEQLPPSQSISIYIYLIFCFSLIMIIIIIIGYNTLITEVLEDVLRARLW